MISLDEVHWLYRCLLGREPESDEVIAETSALYSSFTEARSAFLSSREFANLNAMSTFYRHDASVMPATRARSRTLALASIVKNETFNIETMLLSCLSVVDFVALLDTGSTDDTLEKAKTLLESASKPFTIGQSDFSNFAEARNEAIALVPPGYDWILMLDADEHLAPEDYWRLNALLDSDVDAWQLPRFNFVDRDKTEPPRPYPDYQRRLFRNRPNSPVRFDGAVHEEPLNIASWGFAPASDGGRDGFIGGPHIHHMGQVDLSLERWQQKHEFYTKLRCSEVQREASRLEPSKLDHQREAYSQFGEDGVLAWLFHNRTGGFYVDIGCHHPFRFSNTAYLYLRKGWHGMNVDVDERAIAAFCKSRPDDINVLAGVAASAGEMEIYLFEEGAVNTFNKESADSPAWSHIPRTSKLVEVTPLSALLHKHLASDQKIDYLNIDAEGLDFDILTSNDWSAFAPDVISVECDEMPLSGPDDNRTYRLLAGLGYRLVSHVAVTSIYQKISRL